MKGGNTMKQTIDVKFKVLEVEGEKVTTNIGVLTGLNCSVEVGKSYTLSYDVDVKSVKEV